MLPVNPQVTNPEEDGVPAQGMPVQPGVPSPDGMAEQGAADVETLKRQVEESQKKIQELEQARERDVSQLRSTLDSRHAQERQEYEARVQEYETKMHQAAMANMDEAERVAYRLQVAEDRNRKLELEREAARQEAQSSAGMMQYAKGFMEQGVKFEQLDFNQGLGGLYASGWQALQERNAARDARLAELEQLAKQPAPVQQPVPQQQNVQQFLKGNLRQPVQPTPTPTTVMTGHGQQPSGTKTMGDVVKALENQFPGQKFDEDKVFTWIERRYLSPDILEGIDWNQPVG